MDFRCVEAHELSPQNPIKGDLYLDDTGDVLFDEGADAIVQHLRARFRTWRGEVFTDLRIGFPWREDVLKKGVDLVKIRALAERTIATTPGIAEVNLVQLDHGRAARTLAIRFRARTTEGAEINSEDYGPFVLEVGA